MKKYSEISRIYLFNCHQMSSNTHLISSDGTSLDTIQTANNSGAQPLYFVVRIHLNLIRIKVVSCIAVSCNLSQ